MAQHVNPILYHLAHHRLWSSNWSSYLDGKLLLDSFFIRKIITWALLSRNIKPSQIILFHTQQSLRINLLVQKPYWPWRKRRASKRLWYYHLMSTLAYLQHKISIPFGFKIIFSIKTVKSSHIESHLTALHLRKKLLARYSHPRRIIKRAILWHRKRKLMHSHSVWLPNNSRFNLPEHIIEPIDNFYSPFILQLTILRILNLIALRNKKITRRFSLNSQYAIERFVAALHITKPFLYRKARPKGKVIKTPDTLQISDAHLIPNLKSLISTNKLYPFFKKKSSIKYKPNRRTKFKPKWKLSKKRNKKFIPPKLFFKQRSFKLIKQYSKLSSKFNSLVTTLLSHIDFKFFYLICSNPRIMKLVQSVLFGLVPNSGHLLFSLVYLLHKPDYPFNMNLHIAVAGRLRASDKAKSAKAVYGSVPTSKLAHHFDRTHFHLKTKTGVLGLTITLG